ncbi:MAG TPA: hypothetical protein VI564_00490 [Candidatus Nanoarchaeia archaeon]|nr:hypothetical protein [Candidatus Nanoarchaeia archaeon]
MELSDLKLELVTQDAYARMRYVWRSGEKITALNPKYAMILETFQFPDYRTAIEEAVSSPHIGAITVHRPQGWAHYTAKNLDRNQIKSIVQSARKDQMHLGNLEFYSSSTVLSNTNLRMRLTQLPDGNVLVYDLVVGQPYIQYFTWQNEKPNEKCFALFGHPSEVHPL